MTIRVIADGVIVQGPAWIESDRTVTAFILGTRQEVTFHGERIALDDVETCEVVCTGDLADAALRYSRGDRVLVSGSLRIQGPLLLGAHDLDSQFVRLEIHAEALGRT